MTNWTSEIVANMEWLAFVRNLGIGFAYAVILSVCIRKFSRIMGDKSQYAIIFPVLIPAMVLIISIIKSSLALSLGLVGALSIVRFRTPIKDPEELTYLFVAIAVGLGIGAGQLMITSICFVFLVAVMFGFGMIRKKIDADGIFLDVDVRLGGKAKVELEDYTAFFKKHEITYQLRRCEKSPDHFSATFYLEPKTLSQVENRMNQLREMHKVSTITLIAKNQILG
jgi:Domain of unknown function (DUF4956)